MRLKSDDERVKRTPFISESFLGEAREYIFALNGKQFKNEPQKSNERFFTIDERYSAGEGKYKSSSGWITLTPEMEEVFANLFQDHKSNQHLEIIEWEDRYLVSFDDGIYISSAWRFMTKEDMGKFKARIIPAVKGKTA